jgi:hypothetical protein
MMPVTSLLSGINDLFSGQDVWQDDDIMENSPCVCAAGDSPFENFPTNNFSTQEQM